MKTVRVKNILGAEVILVSKRLDVDEEYTIPEVDLPLWSSDDAVLSAITGNAIQIGNDSSYLVGYSEQIDWLKSGRIDAEILNFGPTDDLGVPSVVVQKPAGLSLAISSHNLCDPCTWFMESTRVTGETLAFSSGTTYGSDHTYWIDLDHGRQYDEDQFKAAYLPVIYIDGVAQTSGFTINFEDGTVTFDSAPSGVVTADYSYAVGSTYYLQPPPGYKYTLEHTEVNFSVGTKIMPHHLVFELWVYNPNDPPNKVLYNGYRYKSAKDFVTTSNLGQGVLHHFGELTQDVIVLPYNYGCSSALLSSQGTEIRVYINDHQKLSGGEIATVTFYVKLNPE